MALQVSQLGFSCVIDNPAGNALNITGGLTYSEPTGNLAFNSSLNPGTVVVQDSTQGEVISLYSLAVPTGSTQPITLDKSQNIILNLTNNTESDTTSEYNLDTYDQFNTLFGYPSPLNIINPSDLGINSVTNPLQPEFPNYTNMGLINLIFGLKNTDKHNKYQGVTIFIKSNFNNPRFVVNAYNNSAGMTNNNQPHYQLVNTAINLVGDHTSTVIDSALYCQTDTPFGNDVNYQSNWQYTFFLPPSEETTYVSVYLPSGSLVSNTKVDLSISLSLTTDRVFHLRSHVNMLDDTDISAKLFSTYTGYGQSNRSTYRGNEQNLENTINYLSNPDSVHQNFIYTSLWTDSNVMKLIGDLSLDSYSDNVKHIIKSYIMMMILGDYGNNFFNPNDKKQKAIGARFLYYLGLDQYQTSTAFTSKMIYYLNEKIFKTYNNYRNKILANDVFSHPYSESVG